jgi:hypothetical protein
VSTLAAVCPERYGDAFKFMNHTHVFGRPTKRLWLDFRSTRRSRSVKLRRRGSGDD